MTTSPCSPIVALTRAMTITFLVGACLAFVACGSNDSSSDAGQSTGPPSSTSVDSASRDPESNAKTLVKPVAAAAQEECADLGPEIRRALKQADISLHDRSTVYAAQRRFARLIGRLDARVSAAAQRSGLANIERPTDTNDPLYAPQRAVSRLHKFADLVGRALKYQARMSGNSESAVEAASQAQVLFQQAQQQNWTDGFMDQIAPACAGERLRIFHYAY